MYGQVLASLHRYIPAQMGHSVETHHSRGVTPWLRQCLVSTPAPVVWFTDRAVGHSSYSRLAQCVSVHYLVAMVIMDLEGGMASVSVWRPCI